MRIAMICALGAWLALVVLRWLESAQNVFWLARQPTKNDRQDRCLASQL